MKYGVILPIWQLSVRDAETLSLKAEDLGLDGVFVPDHILAPPATTQHYGPNWPDPFSLLAFIAGRTRRIHVGASVIVLPYRNPPVTAKAAATVDQASGGRSISGIGAGGDGGGGRSVVEGSVDEVAGDIRRVRSLGGQWMPFDLPRGDISGMTRAMERLTKEVRPAV